MPPAVVTVTFTVPAVPAGSVTTICVAESLTIVAALAAEVHRRGAGQVRPRDRHRRAAASGPADGLIARDTSALRS